MKSRLAIQNQKQMRVCMYILNWRAVINHLPFIIYHYDYSLSGNNLPACSYLSVYATGPTAVQSANIHSWT